MRDNPPRVITIPAKVESTAQQAVQRQLRVAAYCRFSRVMLTLPIGMGNTNVRFANMLVVFNSTLDTEEVVSKLKQIERQCGDTRMARSRGEVIMDIDLLRYDDELFHQSDWQRHYIKTLMEEMLQIQLTNV